MGKQNLQTPEAGSGLDLTSSRKPSWDFSLLDSFLTALTLWPPLVPLFMTQPVLKDPPCALLSSVPHTAVGEIVSENVSRSVMSSSLWPMDGSPPGSSVDGILQAGTLEWVAIPFSRGSSPTQGLNRGLLHCRQVLYCLSHQWALKYLGAEQMFVEC